MVETVKMFGVIPLLALVTSFMKASIVKSSNLAADFKVTFLSYLFTMGNDCFTCKLTMFVIVFVFVFLPPCLSRY